MIGNRLQSLRKQKGLTQDELADAASLTRGQISKYETDKLVPDLTTIIKLADALDVSVDYLLGRSDVPMILKSGPRAESEDNEEKRIHVEAYYVFSPEQEEKIKSIINEMLEKRLNPETTAFCNHENAPQY